MRHCQRRCGHRAGDGSCLLEDGDVVSIGVHEIVYTDLRKHEETASDVANEDDEFDDGEDEDVATG